MPAHRKNFDEAVDMYERGLSLADVAHAFGTTRQAMWAAMKVRKVKLRSNLRHGSSNHFYRGGKVRNTNFVMVEAVRKGILLVGPCEVCGLPPKLIKGRQRIHGHHDDYNKLLSVRWLCKKHHFQWHKHNKPKPRTTPRMRPSEISSLGGKSAWKKNRGLQLRILAKARLAHWGTERSESRPNERFDCQPGCDGRLLCTDLFRRPV